MSIVKIKRSFLTIPFILVLFGLGIYLAKRHAETSVTERDSPVVLNRLAPVAAANPNGETFRSHLADEASHLADEASQLPASPSTRHDAGASSGGNESKDFSGITTLDPAKPAASSTPEASTPAPEQKTTAPLPLVFQRVDPKSMKIPPDQQKIIDQLQQSFLDQIGGANQDPNDPQYRERWEQARPLIDQELKAQLGQQFFLQYEAAAGKRPAKSK
jgi:hypothetical protein